MEVFSSAEITYSFGPNGFPSQTRWYRSSTRCAFGWKSGSVMKIHDWYCHGLRASSDNHRRTVVGEIDRQIPAVTACRASSGHDQRDNGWPACVGGLQASALTWATCTGLKTGRRPDRFASPNEDTPGAVHQRCRYLRAVSSQTPSDAAIRAFGWPSAAASTIPARRVRRCSVRPERISRSRSWRWVSVNTTRSGLVGGIQTLHKLSSEVTPASSVTRPQLVSDTPIGHDHAYGRPTRINENVVAADPVRPGPGRVAGTGRRRRQVPRRVRLRHRPSRRRRHPAVDAAAVRRISGPLGLRDLPGQQRRLRRLRPAHRRLRRHPRRRPGHRLRPLPWGSHRLDLNPRRTYERDH